MITIFSCPKPFTGHAGIIQRNAIASWFRLTPRPEVILIGDEEGTADICREFGAVHVPSVGRNRYGTPLVSSLFEIGQARAASPLVCYANADMILMSDFADAVAIAAARFAASPFLLVGWRWRLDMSGPLDVTRPGWEDDLRRQVGARGWRDHGGSLDYFVFPRGTFTGIPPFAIGRPFWDGWLYCSAKERKVPVVDCDRAVMAVHQNHDYGHLPFDMWSISLKGKGPEVVENIALLGMKNSCNSLLRSDYLISHGKVSRAPAARRLHGFLLRMRGYVLFLVMYKFYPYSYPLLVALKLVRRAMDGVRGVKRKLARGMKHIAHT